MLRHEDWLDQAKRLHVGQTVRTRHRHERRPNLSIGNTRTHWWAYCQACKEGGRLDKEHVLLGPASPVEGPTSLSLPADLAPVLGSDYEAAVGRFLASKGMMFPYLPKLWYSLSHKRLCLQDDAGTWHGRDMTERAGAKWLHYGKPALAGTPGKLTIVTEDVFSMFKVRYALDRGRGPKVVTTMGAGIGPRAALALKDCTRIVWFYDGDAAGDDGYMQASKRMRVLVPKQLRARPPEGLDPKDMQCADIRALLEGVLD